MTQKIRCAGFGGQGIVLMGRLLAHSAMVEDKHTTFFPQYGAAMRGRDGELLGDRLRRRDRVADGR